MITGRILPENWSKEIMELKLWKLKFWNYTITNTKKLNKAYETPQKRVLVKWNTSKNINIYMKAETFFKKKINNVRSIWDMEKRSIVYIIEIPKEK